MVKTTTQSYIVSDNAVYENRGKIMKIFEFNKKVKIIALIVSEIFLIITLNGCLVYSSENENNECERGFYSYGMKDISHFMESIGHKELSGYNWYDVTRNADGSALRIGVQERRKLIVAKCNGEIEEINTPGELILVDNNNQVIGWLDRPRDEAHFEDKILVRGPFWQYGDIDPGTRYFTETKTVLRGFDIYEIAFPLKHLGSVDEAGRVVQALYTKEDLIYIFTEDVSVRCRNNQTCPIVLYVFKNKRYKLEEYDKVAINKIPTFFPSRFYMKDMSPWSDEVIFVESYDFPNRSKLHRYDLNTKKMQKMGYLHDYGFYLQCDILRKIMAEKNSPKR